MIAIISIDGGEEMHLKDFDYQLHDDGKEVVDKFC